MKGQPASILLAFYCFKLPKQMVGRLYVLRIAPQRVIIGFQYTFSYTGVEVYNPSKKSIYPIRFYFLSSTSDIHLRSCTVCDDAAAKS